MIDKNKQYRTRDGREVRIYATDGHPELTVHGAVKLEDGWEVCAWRSDGRLGGYTITDSDLIEVRPRIQREVWVNVYRNCVEAYSSRHAADCNVWLSFLSPEQIRIACVKLTIDCEEGEGL